MKLYRPATVLVGVMFVLLGGLSRLAAPDQVFDEANRVVVQGTIGEALDYNGSTVTVQRVKFARAYLTGDSDEKPVQSSGIYVAVEYDTVRGTAEVPYPTTRLVTADDTVYAPISETWGNNIDFAEPGFGISSSVVFEVDPTNVEGLTLQVRTGPLYNVLTQDVAVDLGVPDEKVAQQLIDAAAPEYLIPRGGVKRVAS
ncbi:hypothetical protein [Kribbella sp. CA-293567]|uniref:hypothetical protein n=1 Tax=Kribbella sp. CA-293567 TaxID=3002436 RepID=UPI0022DD903D|nr:hypothetical protein [Kribbella sp. CA-293567]WBQ05493.1 hypothetical protein OX958_01540 [Kribbella sp. CA-293567]